MKIPGCKGDIPETSPKSNVGINRAMPKGYEDYNLGENLGDIETSPNSEVQDAKID